MKKGFLFLALAFLAVCGGVPAWSQGALQAAAPAAQVPDTEEVAILETSAGTIVLQLFPDIAPGHVKNFKKLIGEKFYDGIKFHRVIKGFMIQGGCPKTKTDQVQEWGTGNPGYTIKAEFSKKPHVKGTLSMARSQDPNSAGSQFFICHARAPHLDGQYTVFGQTLEGLDIVDKIATAPVKADPFGNKSMPVEPVVIKKAQVLTWGEYKQKKEESAKTQ